MSEKEKPVPMETEEAARKYHEQTDHGRDGSVFLAEPEADYPYICNCMQVIRRIEAAGMQLFDTKYW